MNLSDFIKMIGDEHITWQWLDNSLVNVRHTEIETEITFATGKINGNSMMSAAIGNCPEVSGIVAWVPRSKLDPIIERINKSEQNISG